MCESSERSYVQFGEVDYFRMISKGGDVGETQYDCSMYFQDDFFFDAECSRNQKKFEMSKEKFLLHFFASLLRKKFHQYCTFDNNDADDNDDVNNNKNRRLIFFFLFLRHVFLHHEINMTTRILELFFVTSFQYLYKNSLKMKSWIGSFFFSLIRIYLRVEMYLVLVVYTAGSFHHHNDAHI